MLEVEPLRLRMGIKQSRNRVATVSPLDTTKPNPNDSVKSPTPLEPTLFPKLRVYFADFPYLHCSYRAEAVHLGDLMRLSVRHGVKFTRRQIFKGRRRRAGRRKKPGALPLRACFSR